MDHIWQGLCFTATFGIPLITFGGLWMNDVVFVKSHLLFPKISCWWQGPWVYGSQTLKTLIEYSLTLQLSKLGISRALKLITPKTLKNYFRVLIWVLGSVDTINFLFQKWKLGKWWWLSHHTGKCVLYNSAIKNCKFYNSYKQLATKCKVNNAKYSIKHLKIWNLFFNLCLTYV